MSVAEPTFENLFAAFPEESRAALQKLRDLVRKLVPDAVESVSYGMPAFRLNGKSLVGFGASANHCSFFPMNGHTVEAFAEELAAFETSKGTIRFTVRKPLPTTLVRKIVKSRVAEIGASPATKRSPKDVEVTSFMTALEHPLKKEIEAVRKLILGIDRRIIEGIKWNAPSFRTAVFFATVNLRKRDVVQLVFHRGAKVKNDSKRMIIDDPDGLIEWRSADRCLVTLGKRVAPHRKAFESIVREWIRQM